MELQIKALTPALADDYFDFFEHRAFTDDSPYRCYCQMYQMTRAQEKAAYENVRPEDMGNAARAAAQAQIASGAMRGYLAYDSGVCIGWCNANDRANYPADSTYGARFHAEKEARELAVTCFEIAPECRGRGIATALLARAVQDAKESGYAAVAGFPQERTERFEWDSTGPVRLFEKAGFETVERHSDYIVMKKML